MTVTDADSIGVLINGDNATLANTGDVDVSNSATGFAITSDEGKISSREVCRSVIFQQG